MSLMLNLERADAASVADLMRLDDLLAGLADADRWSVERAIAHHAAEAGGEYVTSEEHDEVKQQLEYTRDKLKDARAERARVNERCVVLESRIGELEQEVAALRRVA